MRSALIAATVLLLAATLLVAIGTSSEPPAPTCAEDMDQSACESALGAVVRRGLPSLHPLFLAAHVEPGSAPGFSDMGHRASVRFELLGVPGITIIELYYDAGGHWGGESDRPDEEIAVWTLAPIAIAIAIALGLLALAWHRRGEATG